MNGTDVFTWVSCHSLIRDHALMAQTNGIVFPSTPVGTRAGTYMVADAQIQVTAFNPEQKKAVALTANWPSSLSTAVKPTWESNCLVLPDADFQVLMEHSLWTQVRNKIQDQTNGANQAGSAEVFWTDVCIPRDTIFYFTWGYNLLKSNPVTSDQHQLLMETLQGLVQVGGQANVGRGWAQSWVSDNQVPVSGLAAPAKSVPAA
jgi:CRISPR-associated protein Cmr4